MAAASQPRTLRLRLQLEPAMPAPLRDGPQPAIDLIKSFERIPDGDPAPVRTDVYRCPAGIWTLG